MSLKTVRATLRDPVSIKTKQTKKSNKTQRSGDFLPPQKRSHCFVESQVLRKIVGVLKPTVKRCKIHNPNTGLYTENMD